MRNIRFQSPFISDVDVLDIGLHFENGEVKSVTDEHAAILSSNPNFTDVTAPASTVAPLSTSQDEED